MLVDVILLSLFPVYYYLAISRAYMYMLKAPFLLQNLCALLLIHERRYTTTYYTVYILNCCWFSITNWMLACVSVILYPYRPELSASDFGLFLHIIT